MLSSLHLFSDATVTLLGIPVVDIDGTFFIQGGIYIGLVLLLNPLLFKPWLATRARRAEAIEGALVKAKSLKDEATSLGSAYDEKLADARDRALTLRSKLRREEEAAQAALLAERREEASKTLDAARTKIAADGERARGALEGRVGELASDITLKILGRAS